MFCLGDNIDIGNFIVDYNTGGKLIHYIGHFGKVKALKALLARAPDLDLASLDFYKLTIAHYAARSGETAILKAIHQINPSILSM